MKPLSKRDELTALFIVVSFLFINPISLFAKEINIGSSPDDRINIIGQICINNDCHADLPTSISEDKNKNLILNTSNSNVGIGKTNPSAKLDVAGTLSTSDSSYLAASSGKVGIGKNNPSYTLDVLGNVMFSDIALGTTPLSSQNYALTTVEYVLAAISGIDSFWSSSGTSVFNNTALNLGVGTSAPISTLHLSKASNPELLIYEASTATTNGPKLSFGVSTSQTATNRGAMIEHKRTNKPASIDGDLLFYTRNTTLNEKMRISSVGNVGIGSTNPTSKLVVEGEAKFNGLVYAQTPQTSQNTALVTVDYVRNTLTSALASTLAGSGTTNYLTKWSSSSSLTNSTIYDNGTNIGIGLSNPSTKLAVSGTFSTTANSYLATSSGNVGIGKTNPTKKLDVSGEAQFSGVVFASSPDTNQSGALTTVAYVSSAINSALGSNTVSGSGTTNYLPKWSVALA